MKSYAPTLAIAAGVSAIALMASTAQAQDTAPAGEAANDERPAANAGTGFAEILVTARRREENLQEVPISITAFDGAALDRLGIQNTTDLEQHTPSLQIGSESIFSIYPNYGIRGQRNDSFLLQQAPTVITYFAGAPQGHPAGFGDTLFDIGSVQVLNGPQGTLFGKNSTGGAVVVEPNRPTDRFEGAANMTYGNFDTLVLGGMVNLATADGSFALRIAGEHQQDDGSMFNPVINQGLRQKNTDAFRVSALINPGGGFSLLTILDWYDHVGAPAGVRLDFVNDVPSGQPGGANLASRPALLAQVQAAYAEQQAQRGNDRYIVSSAVGSLGTDDRLREPLANTIRNWGITNDINIDITDNLRLRNITSYRAIDTRYDADYGGGNYFLNTTRSRQNLEQFTAELQLLGKAFANRLDYVIGAFYFDEDGTEDIAAINFLSQREVSVSGSNKSYAVFAQGTYSLTDNFRATLGGRYNWDDNFARSTSRGLAAGSPYFPVNDRIYSACSLGELVNGAFVAFPLSQCSLQGRALSEEFTYNISLEYLLTPSGVLDSGLIYATTRRGYRAGGLNARGTTQPVFNPYDPETVTNYEVGVKADWLLGSARLRTNIAAFYDKYKDLQRQVSIPVPGAPLPQGTISNAASSRVYGIEFETRLIPFQGFEIGGFYNYINARYTEYTTLGRDGSIIDLSNEPFTRVPKHKFSIQASYTVPVGVDSDVRLSGVYTWQDDNLFEETPLPNGQVAMQPAYGIINARLDWNNVAGTGLDLGLFGRNLTNEYYKVGYADVSTSLGVAVFIPGEPRTYGVQARFRF